MTSDHDEAAIAARLANEIEAIAAARPGLPAAVFAFAPFTAYSLVAVLQLASRHPDLSDVQLDIVLSLAHGIADQLVDVARDVVGTDSTIEATLRAGFDPGQDRPLAGRT
jgi:hypothetical protein